MTQYLRVRNWEKFQHYKDRRPLWIKSYVEILDDYDVIELRSGTQLVYFKLLLVAARLENKIPNDPKFVASLMHLDTRIVSSAFVTLMDKRFLEEWMEERATVLLAEPEPRDRVEAETDKRHKEPRNGMDSFSTLPGEPMKPLGAGRDEAFALLLSRVVGGDGATPKVLWGFCRKLPQERIEGVAGKFSRRCVNPGVAVNALKAEIEDYDRELRSERMVRVKAGLE